MRRLGAYGLAAVLLGAGCAGIFGGSAGLPWGKEGSRYMVAADHPLASEAGALMLKSGGNVVDAAVATSFALAVTRPYSTGLGGGGFMMIAFQGQEPVVLDYRETAPAAASAADYLDSGGKVAPGKTVHGHWAAGVPGVVLGLTTALERYGTMRLAQVMAPAIELAEKGFPVDENTRSAMNFLSERLKLPDGKSPAFAEAKRIFLKDGAPYRVGERFRQPDLAKTLRLVSDGGAEAFYRGVIARRLLDDMKAHRGPLAKEDLEGYRVKLRAPLRGKFRGREILAMPPPSSGGACLLQILGVLDGYDPAKLPRADYFHVLAESMKHAFADRAAYLGDADYEPQVAADVAEMISPERAGKVRAAISLEGVGKPEGYGRRGLKDDSGTSHYSILDAAGNAVAATETINTEFGSLVVPPETGIVLNNELDDFAVSTGVPNEFGLLMSERNLLRPGRRPLSSMSPTILREGGRAVLAAGASGGPRIITGTLQALLHILDFGLRPDAAVAAKRIHHQWMPDRLLAEEGLAPELRAALSAKGHALEAYPGYAGACQVAYASGGRLYGASDPRKGGRPAGR